MNDLGDPTDNIVPHARRIVRDAYESLHSWQDVADWFNAGISKRSFLRYTDGGSIPKEIAQVIIEKGVPGLGKRCPTCGRVHVVGDCHGVQGQPAIVPQGYIVSPAPKPKRTPRTRKEYYRPALDPDLRGRFTNAEIMAILRREIDD